MQSAARKLCEALQRFETPDTTIVTVAFGSIFSFGKCSDHVSTAWFMGELDVMSRAESNASDVVTRWTAQVHP